MAEENRQAVSISGFLLEKIHDGITLPSLLDEIYRTWYVPSIYLDINQQVLFYSIYSGEPDTWEDILVNGQLSAPMRIRIAECSRGHLKAQQDAFTPGLFFRNPNFYVYAPVYKEENLIGYLVMVCLRGRSKNTVLSLCRHLSESVAILTDPLGGYTPMPYNYAHSFIAQELLLLDDTAEAIDGLEETYGLRASEKRKALRPSYRILASVPHGPASDPGNLERAEQFVHMLFPDSYSLIHNNTLFVFFHGLSESEAINPVFYEKLCALPDRFRILVGLSVPFSDLSLRHRFNRQALDLLDMNLFRTSAEEVLIAEECFKELLLYAPTRRIGADAFRLSEVCILQENDRVYGTDYYETLYQYLRHSGHVRKAADALHLDPKSLQYRLRKICSLTGRSTDELLLDDELFFSVCVTHAFPAKG